MMIKKYNEYITEKISNILHGYNKDEMLDKIKDFEPEQLFRKSCQYDLVEGIILAKNNIGLSSITVDNGINLAAYYGSLNVLNYFINNGYSVHNDNDKPIRYAIDNNQNDMVEYLVNNFDYNNDVLAESLNNAVIKNNIEIVNFLLSRDIDISKNGGLIVENAVVNANTTKNYEILIKLLEKHAPITKNAYYFAYSYNIIEILNKYKNNYDNKI